MLTNSVASIKKQHCVILSVLVGVHTYSHVRRLVKQRQQESSMINEEKLTLIPIMSALIIVCGGDRDPDIQATHT